MRFRGFTLIELLVVMAIIGTLSSVVLSSVNVSRKKGSDATIKSDLVNLQTQANLFYTSHSEVYKVDGATSVCTPGVFSYGPNARLLALVMGPNPNAFLLGAMQAAGIATLSIDAAGGPGIVVCNVSTTDWVAQVPLTAPGAGYFCIDKDTATTSPINLVANGSDLTC